MTTEIAPYVKTDQLLAERGSYLLSDALLMEMELNTLLEMRERLEVEAGRKDMMLGFESVTDGILITWKPMTEMEIPG